MNTGIYRELQHTIAYCFPMYAQYLISTFTCTYKNKYTHGCEYIHTQMSGHLTLNA